MDGRMTDKTKILHHACLTYSPASVCLSGAWYDDR